MDTKITPIYRNRKTILGLVVRPRQQMRMAMSFIVAAWIVHLILLGVLVPNWAQLSQVEVSLLILLSASLLSVFSLVAGILLSHRFFGPLVSIKRQIASLREGQYSSRLQLRSTDELTEVKDSLNDLAAALEARHGPGNKAPS